MTHQSLSIEMDNTVQSGDDSLDEVTALIATQFGLTTGIVDIRRNTDGKVESVLLRLPDAIIDSALVKINEHAGVGKAAVCPAQRNALALNDSTPDGIVTSKTYSQVGNPTLTINRFPSGVLGAYNLTSLNSYFDASEFTNPDAIYLDIVTRQNTTFAQSETLTLNFTASDSLDIVRTNDLVVPGPIPPFAFNRKQWWIDVDGKLYPKLFVINGNFTSFTFEESCRLGAV